MTFDCHKFLEEAMVALFDSFEACFASCILKPYHVLRWNELLFICMLASTVCVYLLLLWQVIPLKALKLEYQPYEAKRNLSNMYDIYLADARIMRLLPPLLGKHFYGRKRCDPFVHANADAWLCSTLCDTRCQPWCNTHWLLINLPAIPLFVQQISGISVTLL